MLNYKRFSSVAVQTVLIMAIMVSISNSFAQFAGGNGTAADPWQVATADHLDSVRDYLGAENSGKYFLQTAEIDLGVPPWNEDGGWQPLGINAEESFQGTYDGGAYRISNMTIDRRGMNNSLFGYIDSATIRNIGLKNISIVSGNRSAGIAGTVTGRTVIENCFVTGYIEGNDGSGGIAGALLDNRAIIRNCYSMTDMVILVSMFPNPVLGGVVGLLQAGEVSHCYATGSIMPNNSTRAAAVVGFRAEGRISNIYWNSDTADTEYAVGREDRFPGSTTPQMLTRNLYEGFDFEEVWRIVEGLSYPYLEWQEGPDDVNIHGPRDLTGYGSDRTMHLSWRDPISEIDPLGYNVYVDGELVNEDPVAEHEYQVTDLDNWHYHHFSVTALYESGESMSSNIFRGSAVSFAGGDGSPDNPYQVETAEQLNGCRYALHYHFIQTDDIDLNIPPYNQGEGWKPIGTHFPEYRFKGVYDGAEYVISDMMINREENYQGLFAYSEEAQLRNIVLENVDITGAMYVGGLVAFQNNTRIENCFVSGDITSTIIVSSYTGGLVGHSRHGDDESNAIVFSHSAANVTGATFTGGLVGYVWDGVIFGCKASGNIQGRSSTGGLAGYARNTIQESSATGNIVGIGNYVGGLVGTGSPAMVIENSFARGTILGENHTGGLIGRNTGEIINSYSTGRVTSQGDNTGGLIGSNTGEIESSYWDIESSNQETSAGGQGRMNRQMIYPYDQQTYLNWDFEEVWVNDVSREINGGYPYSIHYATVGPDPYIAANPFPRNHQSNIPTDLDSLSWEYHPHPSFTDPLGFRVYLNTTGEFEEEDDFDWIVFSEGQTEYSSRDLLTDPEYATIYYWQVVPTTIDPEGRGDANNVPVWRFTTEIYPYPSTATNPDPADEEADVPVDLNLLSWTYNSTPQYTNPAGFRVYLNTTGQFDEDDDFVWTPYSPDQTQYNNSAILPDILDENQTYYWKAVPTTNEPEGDGNGDAENVSIWSFTTVDPTNVTGNEIKPLITRLHSNHPNPFNPVTIISFSLADDSNVTLEIYNNKGQKIRTLINQQLPMGEHQLIWNGTDESGKQMTSGIYFYLLKTEHFREARKMIMMK